ncbi:HDOD domain-containing protein [Sulfurospirillum sp. 1612]|uniref:HDOD domain-containing protein n=1 Tax=Sulfurospirillum sp. 1612 TaxID=3094835 RepID=UPI002F9556EE
MDSGILKKIKALPPLDDTVIMIQNICSDTNSSMQDLVKVVQRDPMLTANILKSANSPLYGFSKEINSISHAVSLFGMATIRGFALSSAIKDNIKINLSPYCISKEKFLEISTMQSVLMFKWYNRVDRKMLDVLQPASFMVEVGKLIIAHELIEQNESEGFKNKIQAHSDLQSLSQVEEELTNFTNEEVTAKIFEKWNLETELIEAIEFSNNPNLAHEHIQAYAKALHVVKTSVNIFGILEEAQVAESLKLLESYQLEADPFVNAIETLKI